MCVLVLLKILAAENKHIKLLNNVFFFMMLFSDWFLLVSCLQIDLEPEGKVYVIIDLSGSSSEGKWITTIETKCVAHTHAAQWGSTDDHCSANGFVKSSSCCDASLVWEKCPYQCLHQYTGEGEEVCVAEKTAVSIREIPLFNSHVHVCGLKLFFLGCVCVWVSVCVD